MSRFERVDFNDSKDIIFADHEILLSFIDDIGAKAFYEWWNMKNGGADRFGTWCLKHKRFKEAME